MNGSVIIREYVSSDKEKVIDLFRLNTPDWFSSSEEKDLVYYLENELEQYFVMEDRNKIVGCGGINFEENHTVAKISWDFFHPEYQGKGLGSRLVQYRLKKLQEFKQVKTIIVRTSQHAYGFYEKQGFKLVETIKDYWAKGFDLYMMEYVKAI